MGQILNFPTKKIEPVTVRSRQKHRIAIEILDGVWARRTRWIVQFEIQEVAGYGALKGFKDAAVAIGYRHRFWVVGTRPAREFVAETADLVAAGKVTIWIDGARVQPRIKRSA
ncbi:hypothetical protein UP10_36295 [Bradyrhizobium sp. LTSPM299]|uniref:hypothetical protein n=1 Tax=Bradyrhizobium sp. LTSPM299 TaxID=1619233 RepID=UPI0005CB05DD|nr:hypothetical protein [Bradyrhizobium sp. LTSPM299]KJC55881.1 hypothetical protein UP10_36295 [Bradyrhizobium sp. LTSPM299]